MGNWTVHLFTTENDTEYLRWIVYFRAVDGLEEGAKIFLTSLHPPKNPRAHPLGAFKPRCPTPLTQNARSQLS